MLDDRLALPGMEQGRKHAELHGGKEEAFRVEQHWFQLQLDLVNLISESKSGEGSSLN
jgi:hypothetical protein